MILAVLMRVLFLRVEDVGTEPMADDENIKIFRLDTGCLNLKYYKIAFPV